MRNRAFVLFFYLIQSVAFALGAQRTVPSCKLDLGMSNFSPFSVEVSATSETAEHFVLIDETIERDQPIVRADDFEWKEAISDLLRNRPSSFQFLTEIAEIAPSGNSYLTQKTKLSRQSSPLRISSRGTLPRPAYYGYLHLLCPF